MAYVKRITIKKTLDRSLQYITNAKKSEEGILVSGIHCASHPKVAYKQMMNNKIKYEKGDKNQGYHFVQSFKENEITDPSQAHDIGKEWANKLLEDKYQYVIATHIDKGHIHNHIIINSVNTDGKKYNANKESLHKAREYSDAVISNYGLSIIVPQSKGVHYKEWEEHNKGNSWKTSVKVDIDKAIQKANNFEEFKELMKKESYVIKQGNVKYMTFKKEGMQRAVRAKTLGENYTEEQIVKRIALKEFSLAVEPVKKAHKYYAPTRKHDALRIYKHKRASLSNNIKLTILLMSKMRGTNKVTKSNKTLPTSQSVQELVRQLKFVEEHDIKDRVEVNKKIDHLEEKLKDAKRVLKQLNQAKDKQEIIKEDITKYLATKDKHEECSNANIITRQGLKYNYSEELEKFEKSRENMLRYGIRETKDINKVIQDYKVTLEKMNMTIQYIEKTKLKKDEYKKLGRVLDKIENPEMRKQFRKDIKRNIGER